MTRQASAVLTIIRNLTGKTEAPFRISSHFKTIYRPEKPEDGARLGKYLSEIWGIMDVLIEEGYVSVNADGDEYRLTQRGIHPMQYRSASVWKYIKGNWIAFLALVISIIALLESIGVHIKVLRFLK